MLITPNCPGDSETVGAYGPLRQKPQTKATPLGDLSITVSNPRSNSSGQSSSSGSTISKFIGQLSESPIPPLQYRHHPPLQ